MYGIYEGGVIIAQFAAPLTVRSSQAVFASDTLSLKRDVTKRPGQRWEVDTRLIPLSFGAGDLFSHMIEKGHSEIVQIVTPQNYGAKQRLTTTGIVTGTGSAGVDLITVAGNSGLIPKGTFIKFDNHTKVYLTLADRSGDGTLKIYPRLKTAVSATSFLYADNVIMSCLYDLDTIIGMSYSDGILMDVGTIKLVEKL
jgi:hypothetical protein